MSTHRAAQVHRALVLQARNVGDSDRVIDAWVPKLGRVALWARSARASKRRFAGALQPFFELSVTVVPKTQGFAVEAAHVLRDRSGIRQSLAQIGRASTVVRVVQALWPQGQDAPGVFDALGVALDHLDGGRLARAAGVYPRLANEGGLLPDLTACGACHRPVDGPMRAPEDRPDLVCARCLPKGSALAQATLDALSGARIDEPVIAIEVEAVVLNWVSQYLGRPLRPWALEPLPSRAIKP